MEHIIEQQKERAEVRGALARGYCTKENENKILDPELIEAMALEVDTIITQTHQATFQDTLAEVIMIAESMKESNKLYYNKPLDVLIETLVRKKCKYKE